MKWLISYDLDAPGQNYKQLDDELVRVGAVRVLASQWVLESQYSAVQLRDHFRLFIDSSDRLLVSTLGPWASWNIMIDINKLSVA